MARKKPAAAPAQPDSFSPVYVGLDQLKPHPRNYREHPQDQLDHIVASIKAHGFYRNVVVAQDNTVLAGHGVVLASRQMGLEAIPVIRLPVGPDDPRALSVLTGDNEIGNLAMVDDRVLTEMLKELMNSDAGLLGTGFDQQQLAALAMVTRPASELQDADQLSEWVGMPEYGALNDGRITLLMNFANESDLIKFCENNELEVTKRESKRAAWWPPREEADRVSVKFEDEDAPPA